MLPVTDENQTPHRHRHHRFLAAWVRSPLKIGAVLPSSRTLARAMAAAVDIKKDGAVIELGPGTGVVTSALLEAGVATERLTVIERDPALHALMHAQFPNIAVVCADAAELERVAIGLGIRQVDAIVSSLPLLSMPKAIRQDIERQMAALIEDNGIIVQYTYGHRSPISGDELRRYRLVGKRVKFVLANVPPAHVWVYWRTA